VRAATIAADITRDEDCDRLADAAWNAFGGIEVVLFSSQPANPALGDLLKSIAWSPLRTMRRRAPKMMAAGGRGIIILASSTSAEPVPG
jgi:NAD(P)-dependent dehydrogenase (short-subunit alcohol dehydrogenase family)